MPSTTPQALTVMGRFRAPSILVSTDSYVSVRVEEEIIQKTGDDDQVEDGDPDSMILCEKGSTYGPLREPTRSIQYTRKPRRTPTTWAERIRIDVANPPICWQALPIRDDHQSLFPVVSLRPTKVYDVMG